MRSYFTKSGGSLAETGAVSFMFDRVGSITYDRKIATDDAMLEAAIEAGADDVVSDGDEHEIITTHRVAARRRRRRSKPSSASRTRRRSSGGPQNTISVDDETGEKILRLINALEENDDVQTVSANFEVSDALIAKMEG